MSASVLTYTNTHKWDDGKAIHAVGQINVAAGDYAAGGFACDLLLLMLPAGCTLQPIWASIVGMAGYKYEYDSVNKKLITRQSAGFTPAGTNSAPTVTLTGTHASAQAVSKSAGGALAAADDATYTGVTGVQAPVFTGTAVAAAASSELATAAAPAAVVADTIMVHAIFRKLQ